MTPDTLRQIKEVLDEGGISYGEARSFALALAEELENTMKILKGLATRHEGYQFGTGPCVCEWHKQARALTGEGN